MNGFYHRGALELQDRLDTRRLADHIRNRYVSDRLGDDDIGLIRDADCLYLATADDRGRPDCSYKGGLPGFVRVLDRRTLRFPSYDGNGMYRSLGNILVNPSVGLLFIDYGHRLKLRLNGDATVSTRPEDLAPFEGAEAAVTVRVREAFENCPRYLHDRTTGEHSQDCPRKNHVPANPEWKLKPEYDGLVRRTTSPSL